MTDIYGVYRLYNTHGHVGETDLILEQISECDEELASNSDCLSFYYGTQLTGPGEGIVDDAGVLHEGDPFTVWTFETWTNEESRADAYSKGELASLNKRLAPFLEFEPEEGVRLKLRNSKQMQ